MWSFRFLVKKILFLAFYRFTFLFIFLYFPFSFSGPLWKSPFWESRLLKNYYYYYYYYYYKRQVIKLSYGLFSLDLRNVYSLSYHKRVTKRKTDLVRREVHDFNLYPRNCSLHRAAGPQSRDECRVNKFCGLFEGVWSRLLIDWGVMTEKRGSSGSTIKQSLESTRIFLYSSTYVRAVKQKVANEAENRE